MFCAFDLFQWCPLRYPIVPVKLMFYRLLYEDVTLVLFDFFMTDLNAFWLWFQLLHPCSSSGPYRTNPTPPSFPIFFPSFLFIVLWDLCYVYICFKLVNFHETLSWCLAIGQGKLQTKLAQAADERASQDIFKARSVHRTMPQRMQIILFIWLYNLHLLSKHGLKYR